MVSRYSIIQYVPNPIADERINIGVLAFDDRSTSVRFLSNWERVRHFGMEDIDFLKDFASRMASVAADGLLFPGDSENGTPKHERLLKVAQSWFNSIQLTEPRGSLEDVETLLENTVETYLVEALLEKPKVRDRAFAVRLAKKSIRKALERCLGDKEQAKRLVQSHYSLSGNLKKHNFDVVVANGRPYFAAQGISFEVQIKTNLQDSMILKISDLKKYQPDFPLGIVTLPPNPQSPNYEKLEKIYKNNISIYSKLGAEVLKEDRVENWVTTNLEKVEL